MQVLGRASSVGAYVRHGAESGYIKICLKGERKDESITITRKIDARNKSDWLLNGKFMIKLAALHDIMFVPHLDILCG